MAHAGGTMSLGRSGGPWKGYNGAAWKNMKDTPKKGESWIPTSSLGKMVELLKNAAQYFTLI